MDEPQTVDHPAWPERALLLGVLGALAGYLIATLTGVHVGPMWTESPIRMALATFLGVSGIALAFSLERVRWTWSAAFAAAGGLVAAFVTWWNGSPNNWGADEGWHFFAGVLAVAVAVPLFQAIRDSEARWPAPTAVHAHAWGNLILWGVAWAFVAASFLLTLLLAELFHLIGIDWLRSLIRGDWFGWTLAGAAFGGAVGLLRDRDQILGTLQRVGRAILAVLAPVLAVGLVVFVAALPFTGLQPLWDETQATTPILLVCALGAVFLANAAIGNSADEEARSRAIRWSAAALLLVILPLAVVAAISTGKRIGQYGLTPDRLWACVFVLVAVAFGLGYLYALARGRSGWPDLLRRVNVQLAACVCVLALFLALPILSFGALSAKDQLGRLQSGKVAPERFDWAAMRFDFGPAGRRALERLAASDAPVIRQRAREALAATTRWALPAEPPPPDRAPPPPPKLVVDGGLPVPAEIADAAGVSGQCWDRTCRLVFVEPDRAVLIAYGCDGCAPRLFARRPDGSWAARGPARSLTKVDGPPASLAPDARVEVRPVELRQVFIDGRPAGPPFDP